LKGEVVVLAKGVSPNAELLEKRESGVSRGVRVNERMETCWPGIFAVGDLFGFRDLVYQKPRINPMWPNAVEEGRIVGLNMTGAEAEYRGTIGMNVTELFGVRMGSLDQVEPEEGDREWVFVSPEGRGYRRFVVTDGRIEGAVLMVDLTDCGIPQRFTRTGMPMEKNVLGKMMTCSPGMMHGLWGVLRT